MINYREILRLKSLGMNKQETASSVGCSRNTVADVLRRAEALKLCYPMPSEMTDGLKKIEERVFLGCSSLTSVTIPYSVTTLESYAFSGYISLTAQLFLTA